MGKYQIIKGDATKPVAPEGTDIIIPHVVNDMGRWGSGFVKAISAKWENVEDEYRAWALPDTPETNTKRIIRMMNCITYTRFDLGGMQLCRTREDGIENKSIFVANLVGQHKTRDTATDGRPPIRYYALATAMKRLADYLSGWTEDAFEIHCPKFGSDLAGGNWDAIEQLIHELWVERGFTVTVYEFD